MNWSRRDTAVATTLVTAAGLLAFILVLNLDPRFLDPATGNDIWFEGDLGRLADEMTHRWAAHSRAPVHPLFSLLTVSAAYPLRALGLGPTAAVAAVSALSAGAWMLACYALMRALGHAALDALALALLAACSAAGLFWLTVPETMALGSASVLAAVTVGVVASERHIRERWLIAASAASLSITVTNWMAGLAASAMSLTWKRAIQVSANALALVVVLWGVQRVVVPHADFFVGYSNEQRYFLRPEAQGPLSAVKVSIVNGMMMPRLSTTVKPGRGSILTVQGSRLREQTALWMAGTSVWLIVVACGVYVSLVRKPGRPGERLVLIVAAGQLALDAIYGTETFLYTLNLIPLLVAVGGAGLESRGRWLVRAGVVALLVMAVTSNARRLHEARRYFTPAVAARIVSTLAPTSVPSSAALR